MRKISFAIRALLTALAILVMPGIAMAQTTAHDDDIAFVLDVLRTDYAGWETKVAGGREAEFEREVALARQRIADNPDARMWALGALLDWFGDDHLGLRSNIVSPPNPWAQDADSTPARNFTPPPGNEFAFRRLSADTVMLRVPTFHIEYFDAFEALLAEHHDTITSTPNLLIDLRGNNGGSDQMYARLMSYLYTRPIYQIGVELRDTPRNLAALQANVDSGEYPPEVHEFVQNVLDRAEASDSDFVPLSDGGFEIVTYPQVYEYPRRVGILAEGAGSSGDQFAIDARASRKVTLLGGPTAGVIDYSNVITAPAPSGDFELGWPMTRSMRLPQEPFDNVGVPPDVPFPAGGVADEIAWAQGWLESRAD
ncbi:S41 family peptidase [Aurantiacibacter zhengii]|nr:S41 family peptidase [Aurantiacibacter zhengii]